LAEYTDLSVDRIIRRSRSTAGARGSR
jgi:hypothetical protein